jgi:U3 small nucleolar RNA-associated protein 12
MVKAYLRYEQSASFGSIASRSGNVVYDVEGKLAISPALEEVIIWHLKKGIVVARWREGESQVTRIARNPNGVDYAVGYEDGSIRIWNIKTHTSNITFHGHKNGISALCFDETGNRLASGGRDTDIIIWDVVGEVGLYRLRGHTNMVTSIEFLPTNTSTFNYLLSTSKDTMIKLWDLTIQHCIETHIGHRNEIWSMTINPEKTLLVTASSDEEIKFWHIQQSLLQQENLVMEKEADKKIIEYFGSIKRQSKDYVSRLLFHPSGEYLLCQSSGKFIEIFRILSKEQVLKKRRRKQKRLREKGQTVENMNEALNINELVLPYQTIHTSTKLCSMDLSPNIKDWEKSTGFQLLTSLNDNTIQVYYITKYVKGKDLVEPSILYSIDLYGHRSDIRTLSLSSNDDLLCSASNGKFPLLIIITIIVMMTNLKFRYVEDLECENYKLY